MHPDDQKVLDLIHASNSRGLTYGEIIGRSFLHEDEVRRSLRVLMIGRRVERFWRSASAEASYRSAV